MLGSQTAPGPWFPAGPAGQQYLRNFGGVPPVLAANNIPVVGAVTGVDGCSCQTPTNGGFGTVFVYSGSSPSSGGSVALVFPNTPPTIKIAGNQDAFGTLSQNTVSKTVTISWTGTPHAGGLHKISYSVAANS